MEDAKLGENARITVDLAEQGRRPHERREIPLRDRPVPQSISC